MIRIHHKNGPLGVAPIVARVTFSPDGCARCLYTEAIDLTTIGKLHVERATRIEFDDHLQAWRVWDREGCALFTAPSRQACLEWERAFFDR